MKKQLVLKKKGKKPGEKGRTKRKSLVKQKGLIGKKMRVFLGVLYLHISCLMCYIPVLLMYLLGFSCSPLHRFQFPNTQCLGVSMPSVIAW